jgi:geranylgeranyl reductase family protein
MTVHDAVVIGGGPAGATAARVLAERGARVVLLEKHALPRYKTCGGGVVGRALSVLPPAAAQTVEHACHVAEMNLGDGLTVRTRRAEPLISMVMRDRFDAALVEAARGARATVRASCPARDLASRDDTVEVATDDGLVTTRYVIVADGATSPMAARLGWRPAPRRAPALEAEVAVSAATFARFAAAARFDFAAVPGGYGWVFPKRAHLSIGVAATRAGHGDLHEVLARYLAALDLGPLEGIERHGFLIPLRPRDDGLTRGRVLLAGDAAGLADPLTGEGITAALESGALAARAVLAGGAPAAVSSRYETALAPLRRDLRVGRALAHLLYAQPRARRWLFRHLGQPLGEGVTEVLMGHTTYAGILGRPRSYRHLLRALRWR